MVGSHLRVVEFEITFGGGVLELVFERLGPII